MLYKIYWIDNSNTPSKMYNEHMANYQKFQIHIAINYFTQIHSHQTLNTPQITISSTISTPQTTILVSRDNN